MKYNIENDGFSFLNMSGYFTIFSITQEYFFSLNVLFIAVLYRPLVVKHILRRQNSHGSLHGFGLYKVEDHLHRTAFSTLRFGTGNGVYYCVQGGEKDRFTPEEYTKFVTPSDLKVLEHANKFSDCNVLHCCGWAGIPNHLEVWQNYPAKAINWACFVENVDLTNSSAASVFSADSITAGTA